jgi:glycerate dehydrogenase|tara:strand:+ start:292 stop:1248 length:957 start_codon:yes stop_codon:yes gene_type:complete
MQAVFLDRQTFDNKILLTHIKQHTDALTCYQTTQPADTVSRCQNAEIIITNKVVLSAKILEQLPKLKLICIAATGTNNVDIKTATSLGIAVTNVSGYANHSVTQYIFSQILEYYSQTSHHHKNTEQGLWQTSPTFCYHGNGINELAGKTLGIIGYGSLGQSVARLAKAFGMKVMIAERKSASKIREGRNSFTRVLQSADIISLHCPQTIETEQLVSDYFLQEMKSTAMLINTARGALIDNQALINALTNEKIAYAVLDVLEQEPPSRDHPLLGCDLPNLKITAHIAWASFQAQQRLIELIADNILAFKQDRSVNRVDN